MRESSFPPYNPSVNPTQADRVNLQEVRKEKGFAPLKDGGYVFGRMSMKFNTFIDGP